MKDGTLWMVQQVVLAHIPHHSPPRMSLLDSPSIGLPCLSPQQGLHFLLVAEGTFS